MALIFPIVLIVFTVFQVSRFNKPDCLDFIANDEWLQFTQPQSSGLSCLGAMLEFYKSCNKNRNQFQSFKMHFFKFGLRYRRKPLTTRWKTIA